MNVYVKMDQGIGNCILTLIILLFIKQTCKCNVFVYKEKTIHDKTNDYDLNKIFIKIGKYITFINENQFNNILLTKKPKYIHGKTITNIFNINNILKQETYIIRFHYLWKYTNEIIEYVKNNNFFEINQEFIPKNLILPKKYACIHIRFGDKVCYLKKITNHLVVDTLIKYTYILYTPEFYKKFIRYFEKKKIPIIIVTDSIEIVKNLILNDIKYKNITISEHQWWIDFYILTKAKYIILSHSTFSFAGAYLNKNIKNKHIVLLDRSKKYNNIGYGDFAISNKWKIMHKEKYILNYNDEKINNFLTNSLIEKYCIHLKNS